MAGRAPVVRPCVSFLLTVALDREVEAADAEVQIPVVEPQVVPCVGSPLDPKCRT